MTKLGEVRGQGSPSARGTVWPLRMVIVLVTTAEVPVTSDHLAFPRN
jgi:hypothetical protein